jgi:pyruvate dehydrogenase E1 component alpha subunit
MATPKTKTRDTYKKETLVDWYRQMVLIRQFETKCDVLYREKKITGVYMHLYSGHEATGVGALAALSRGVSANAIMAEMMGKVTGTSGGKGGSMHLASREHNFWGGYAIVAGHLPLATGIALECRYNETENVVLCFIGDGATNNGYFHESLNLSALWDLPVVWVIENNGVGMGTLVQDASAQVELHKRAIAYNMKDLGRVDGQDVIAVHQIISEGVEYARKHGPVLIESMTYRYKGHGVSDRSYDKRLADELQEWIDNKDPINILHHTLVSKYKNIEPELLEIEKETAKIVEESVEYAVNSPDPTYEDLIANVYVGRGIDG